MSFEISTVPSLTDVTAIQGTASAEDVALACRIAEAYECASVVVNPTFLSEAARLIAGNSAVRRACTLSFPFGSELLAVKIYAADQIALSGAQTIEIAANLGAIHSCRWDIVQREISLVHATVDIPMNVIIEASGLSDMQLTHTAYIASDAGALCIVVGTGLEQTATPEQIGSIRTAIGRRALIKVYAKEMSLEQVEVLHEAGADRFGLEQHGALQLLREIDAKLGRPSPSVSTENQG